MSVISAPRGRGGDEMLTRRDFSAMETISSRGGADGPGSCWDEEQATVSS